MKERSKLLELLTSEAVVKQVYDVYIDVIKEQHSRMLNKIFSKNELRKLKKTL